MIIFVVNCGSSSIKYKLYNMADESVLATGVVERVGSSNAVLTHNTQEGQSHRFDVNAPDHTAGMREVLAKLTDPDVGVLDSVDEIGGVGHRVLHAGERYSDSVLIDDEVIQVIRDYFVLGPLHNPPNLAGIEASMQAMPGTPQVAVFDTAFFASMPQRAWMYAVPYEWYEKYRVRKYGFHGTSHRYVTYQIAQLLQKPQSEVNLITVHLGNGCSMTAVKDGKAIEHSMGLTPLQGLVMGTRSGDIDPAMVFYVMENAGLSADEIYNALNKKSGLLGVSGVTNDMRDCLAAAEGGNERARLAVEMFIYRIIRYLGSYYTILPALDAIVLTGGIGENSVPVRDGVVKGLHRLGIRLDSEANERITRGQTGVISTPASAVPVWIVPTNEELMIARDTREIVTGAVPHERAAR